MRRGWIACLGAALALAPSAAAQADIDAYERSWIHRALDLQYELGGHVPLRNAPWVGTHNSFNSPAEMGPALSAQDSNQRLSIIDQLRLGVRSVELDVHWFPSLQGGGVVPVVCHATGQHAGCSTEKPLALVLDEIAGWLRGHPDEVLLLYVEDHLDNEQGYDSGAAVVETKLGDLLYRPAGPGCQELPLELTRNAVRDAGRQVLVMTRCGKGAAWPAVGFDGSAREEARPRGYTDFPRCGTDFTRAQYDGLMIRYFEDSTRLTEGASNVGATTPDDGITPETAARMARCGVDLLGLDQLAPDDGRLEALVWSWAPDEPRAAGGRCAVQRTQPRKFRHARWETRRCGRRHRVACRNASGGWSVPRTPVRAARAGRVCSRSGATHSVPRTGYEAQLLRVAMRRVRVRAAWLAYRRSGANWSAR
jgi:hypothetical protein